MEELIEYLDVCMISFGTGDPGAGIESGEAEWMLDSYLKGSAEKILMNPENTIDYYPLWSFHLPGRFRDPLTANRLDSYLTDLCEQYPEITLVLRSYVRSEGMINCRYYRGKTYADREWIPRMEEDLNWLPQVK